MTEQPPTLLALDGVSKSYTTPRGPGALWKRWRENPPAPRVVDGASLDVKAGEIVGLVGESGSGKTTLGRIAAGLLTPDNGRRQVTAGHPLAVQMIFQHAAAALNPRLRVQELLAEAPRVHGLIAPGTEAGFVAAALQEVGLEADLAHRYPHQLSGGQAARIGIARALAVRPQLLVCDEILAALDVLVQARILSVLRELCHHRRLGCLFISHDLAVVHELCDRAYVMQAGRIVEAGVTAELFRAPRHPYTRGLLAAMPSLDDAPPLPP